MIADLIIGAICLIIGLGAGLLMRSGNSALRQTIAERDRMIEAQRLTLGELRSRLTTAEATLVANKGQITGLKNKIEKLEPLAEKALASQRQREAAGRKAGEAARARAAARRAAQPVTKSGRGVARSKGG